MHSRFVDDAFGFALTWNYWFNDAVSTAADLVALQLLLQYWTDNFPGWALSLVFLFILIAINVISVGAYGELEYWLSLLKVITIVVSGPTAKTRPSLMPCPAARPSSSSASPSMLAPISRAATLAGRIGAFPVPPLSAASVALPLYS